MSGGVPTLPRAIWQYPHFCDDVKQNNVGKSAIVFIFTSPLQAPSVFWQRELFCWQRVVINSRNKEYQLDKSSNLDIQFRLIYFHPVFV